MEALFSLCTSLEETLREKESIGNPNLLEALNMVERYKQCMKICREKWIGL